MLRAALVVSLAVSVLQACGSSPQDASAAKDAPALPDYCAAAQSLTRPLHPFAEGDTGTFSYRYSMIRRDPTKPTLVFLPGGPGDTSIDYAESQEMLDYFFPTTFNLLLTEPRGVGCNLLPDQLPDGTFTTRNIADDVAAAIEAEGLSDVVVFGWSYGTMLATALSERLPSHHVTARSYLLQGTLGKYLEPTGFDAYSGFVEQWEATKARLPAAVVEQLSAESLPFGLSGRDWASYLSMALMVKHTGQPLLEESLPALLSDDAAVRARLKQLVVDTAASVNASSPGVDRLYTTLLCDEISQSDNTDMALIDGHLVGHQNPHVCDGRPMAHPFDSATLPMGAPIIYMQGDDDPATTLQNARYHFEGQTGSRRSFVTVRTGAHFPFGLLAECKEAIWDAAAAGGEGLAQALAGCRAETSLEVAP